MSTQNQTQRFKDLVYECDNFPHLGAPEYLALTSTFWTFAYPIGSGDYKPLGYLIPSVVQALQELPVELKSNLLISPSAKTISLTATTYECRTKAIANITSYWKAHDAFHVLSNWCDEKTAIYAPSGVLWASVERAASSLFGLVSYYVYLIAYTIGETDIKVWVQRRASSKASHGGMLDGTVSGAIVAGSTPLESIEREALEEASISPEIMARAKPLMHASSSSNRELNMKISPTSGTDEMSIRSGCGFGYEVELREGEVPVPNDGEVVEFYCLGVQEIKKRLGNGEFTPYAAKMLVLWLAGKRLIEGLDIGRRELEFPLM